MAHPLAQQFRRQARNCLPGSPLYAGLLDAMAADLDDGGPTATVMEPYRDDPSASAPPLRLMGALHRMVLQRQAPELALHYPSVGGSASARQAWPAARRLLEAAGSELTGLAGRPVQTNEAGRCAALLGALLVVATRTGLPIRLFEIGASAGLNLNVDRYAYAVDNRVLGQPDSPLRLGSPWRNYPPAELSRPVRLVERAGCDPLPVDPGSTEGRLTLTSYVWADSTERLERLRAALQIATEHPTAVERARAVTWLPRRIGWPRTGSVAVVWHSVVLQYVDAGERAALGALFAAAGERATPTAPLALAGMEHVGPADSRGHFEVTLTMWPHGTRELLGTTVGHGVPTTWAAGGTREPQHRP